MMMQERDYTTIGASYRFGFNGQESDNEVAGPGNSNTAEFWQYDGRLGRRWNLDPVINPGISPYATFENSPILLIDTDGDEPTSTVASNSRGPGPKLKFIWQVARVFSPWWWTKKGKARMLRRIQCNPRLESPYRRQKRPRSKWRPKLIRVVDKEKVRTRSTRIKLKERNGQPSDQVINTSSGGQIVINNFDDRSLVDQLIIEDATGGNGVGTDPNNNNQTNDLFTSPIGPDGPNTSPPIRGQNVPVTSNQTRIRVRPNLNGSPNTTYYDADIRYQWTQRKTVHREYLFGFIPLFWKNKSSGWQSAQNGATASPKRVKWRRVK